MLNVFDETVTKGDLENVTKESSRLLLKTSN